MRIISVMIDKCGIQGCSGEYENKLITYTTHFDGQIIVIDHVPAEVCFICGDTLFAPETVEHLEKLVRERKQPSKSIPLYEYA